ncbi:unnamed protein product [Medioppia subpectinata]|uniref:Uncharacterized protein n=1 Tax=Medioppia subpectinata TaxID=1979941 RepID=A0A7R9Q8Z6_9ACAR|nr:unnamed protein product [Medioppia subpectinata]CAG2115837.1 unnamed protein product [Medioppia subpectinata]
MNGLLSLVFIAILVIGITVPDVTTGYIISKRSDNNYISSNMMVKRDDKVAAPVPEPPIPDDPEWRKAHKCVENTINGKKFTICMKDA